MPKQGTTLTTLYDLGKVDSIAFDEFRQKRGVAPYFHDDDGAYIVHSTNGPFLDLADLDELDRAFLHGAQTTRQEGIRLPWPYKRFIDHPRGRSVEATFDSYTLWPNSHILIPISHELLAFVHEILASCEADWSLH